MEFNEFVNPEEKSYDINASLNSNFNTKEDKINIYSEQLLDLIGILEDVTEEELINNYGISLQEYFEPTAETIEKVSKKLSSVQNGRRR